MNEFENKEQSCQNGSDEETFNGCACEEACNCIENCAEECGKECAEELCEEYGECTEDCACDERDCGRDEAVSQGNVDIEAQKQKSKLARVGSFYSYVESFMSTFLLAVILFLFVFRPVVVDGASMQHTLHHEDKLIISNTFYTPKTGDIVVINPESHPEQGPPIIKRVIATEGQRVRIDYKNWEVYVDGVKLDEPYIQAMRQEMIFLFGDDVYMHGSDVEKYRSEFVVGEGKVFVMGDNRNNSRDSRSSMYGEMGVNRILGRVILRISPKFGVVE